MNSRLEKLQEFLKETPNDPFLIYGIALEYNNLDKNQAKIYFNKLLTEFSEYLPTYYHAGKLEEEFHNFEEAISIYKKGIELAQQQGDRHAKSELETALFEIED